jgi:hypothetical protein
MSYYIRILGTRDPDIHPDELQKALETKGLAAKIEPDTEGTIEQWKILDVSVVNRTPGGGAVAPGDQLLQIERNVVIAGELGQQEIDEFRRIIRQHRPESAAGWLGEFFDKVKVIYALQVMDTALKDDHFEIVSMLKTAIWEQVGGILQDDNEGFSNEDGYHILWQFPDTASGDKYCAVLGADGVWQRFRMDLGDHFQRMAFQNGEVPQMAVRL